MKSRPSFFFMTDNVKVYFILLWRAHGDPESFLNSVQGVHHTNSIHGIAVFLVAILCQEFESWVLYSESVNDAGNVSQVHQLRVLKNEQSQPKALIRYLNEKEAKKNEICDKKGQMLSSF